MTKPDRVAHQIIGAAIEVHKRFGPGLLESVYTSCLGHEIAAGGLAVEIQKPLSLRHKNLHIHRAYVLDLLVEDCVIVEVKCVERVTPLHRAQLLTYLRLTGCTLGLVVNFNVPLLKQGIHRVVNGHLDANGRRL